MSLEDVLRIMEKDNGVRRNPEGYFFSIFGEPSETGIWGYRVEGHHLATNFTLKGGKVDRQPELLRRKSGGNSRRARKGLRVLARGRRSWTRTRRLTDARAEKDRESSAKKLQRHPHHGRRARLPSQGQPNGLQASKLNSKQQALLQHWSPSTPTTFRNRSRRTASTVSRRPGTTCTSFGLAARIAATRTTIVSRPRTS